MKALQQLEQLMSPERSYKNYRETMGLLSTTTPRVPFLGVYLTDATFIEEGNTGMFPRTQPTTQRSLCLRQMSQRMA
jgi:hypothetical protein